MDIFSIILLAVGLSMDAFAVSISTGICVKEIRIGHSFKMGFFFGLFQAIMPLLGWLAGMKFRVLFQNLDHWIVLLLLGLIGGKMIKESFDTDCDKLKKNPLHLWVLLGLSIATSIDALAAGLSFGFLKLNIWVVISIIGCTTFTFSFVGTRIGKIVGCRFGSRMELIGGIILIGIGIKIFVEHFLNRI